jgi:predicted kinase
MENDNAKEHIQVIVVMAGLPGSGKSTLADLLAARLGGLVVSKDRIRGAAFGPLVDYSQAQDDFCMELVYRTAGYLRETRPDIVVVIDGRTFSRRRQVTRLLEVLPETPRWIECVCAGEVARQRLEAAPDHIARNRNYDLYCAIKSTAEPLDLPRLTVDTGAVGLVEAVRRASEYLLLPPPDLAGG